MKNSHIELLEEILKYLRLHNRVLYDSLNNMLIEIYDEKKKRNEYKLKLITEKRKIDKTYGGHNRKKGIDK